MGELYSVLCAVFWALGVILLRRSGEHVQPLALNLFKNTLAALLFAVTLPIIGVSFAPPEATTADWVTLLVSGAIGLGIADTLFLGGLNRLGAGRAAIAECAYGPSIVVCTVIHPQLDETVNLRVLLAIGLVMAGIYIITRGERSGAQPTGTERRTLIVGFALAMSAVSLMAVGVVIAKPVLDHSDVWWATLVRLLGGFVVLVPLNLTPKARPALGAIFRPSRAWRVVVPAAFVATYLAMILWLSGIKYTQTITASVLNQTSTFFIAIFAAIFLGEALTLRRLTAISLGFAGAVAVAAPRLLPLLSRAFSAFFDQ